MSWLFSKRCQKALKEGRLDVSIPETIRVRLCGLLNKFSERWEKDISMGWIWVSTLDKVFEEIKYEHGLEELSEYSKEGKKITFSNLENFIMGTENDAWILDIVELFYNSLSQEDRRFRFQREFNQIMEESNLKWRMANGKIFPVDSIYIEEQILRRTYELLTLAEFEGALQEFEKARECLVNGDYAGAIQNANLAVESTIKYILKIPRALPNELYRGLIKSGLIPNYFEGSLRAFEKHILKAVAKIRNEEPGAGHGKGKKTKPIPPSLAELAVNLAGVLINFLVKRYLEKTSEVEPG